MCYMLIKDNMYFLFHQVTHDVMTNMMLHFKSLILKQLLVHRTLLLFQYKHGNCTSKGSSFTGQLINAYGENILLKSCVIYILLKLMSVSVIP